MVYGVLVFTFWLASGWLFLIWARLGCLEVFDLR